MNEKTGERIFALLILVFVLVFLFTATRMNSVAGRMPLIVGSFTLILMVVYFANEFWPRKSKAEPKFRADLDEDDEHLAPEKDALNWYDVRVWGWLIVLFVAVYILGIAIGIAIFTMLFYRYAAKQSWRGGLIFGAIQAAFLYVVFDILFKAALYQGLIMEMIQSALG